jgi:hypothetical protein
LSTSTLPVPMIPTHTYIQVKWLSQPQPQPLSESVTRLMHLRVYDSRDNSHQSVPSPSLYYSHTHTTPSPHPRSSRSHFTLTTQCMCGVLDRSVSSFSLSLYRHPLIYTLFSSRFTLLINNNLDQSLNDTSGDKLRKYRADYNFNPPRGVRFMTVIATTWNYSHQVCNFSY